jgi:hypothetical protein
MPLKLVAMKNLLDPAVNPWLDLLPPGRLAELRADIGPDGARNGLCVHGRPLAEILEEWRYEALDSMPAPVDWATFMVKEQPWFAYLDPDSAAACTAEFAALDRDDAPDGEREEAFSGWRSTGAICSYRALATRLREPHEPPKLLPL